jgi:3-oxoacyl-[acyl-carrier protein] reductase
MEDIKDKVIILTGASKGIGRVTAIKLSAESPMLVLASRSMADLEKLKTELKGDAEKVLLVEADVSKEEDCKKITEQAVNKFGKIDVLINNAAQFGRYKVIDLPIEEFDRIQSTNIRGVIILTKLVLPHMISREQGTIINISSTAGKRGYPGGTAYAASKHALNAFSECLSAEVREYNIRVVTISPSSVDTRLKPESEQKKIGKGVYMRAEDVADSIILALKLPQRALIKDIEIWGTNPNK